MHVLQGQDYEVRTYHATKWVSTALSGMHLDAAMNAGFHRLFSYIQGNNHNSECHQFCSENTTRMYIEMQNKNLCYVVQLWFQQWRIRAFVGWKVGKKMMEPGEGVILQD